MEYALFEQRCLELLYKTDAKVTPPFAAYRLGCAVEHAQAHLDAMASRGVLSLDVGGDGNITYDVTDRPAPTGEPLSWEQSAAPVQPAMQMHPQMPPQMPHQPYPMQPMQPMQPMPNVAVGYHPPPGAPPPMHMPVNIQVNNMAPAVIVLGAEKSVAGAVLLGFFFGPLGLLYATGLGALVMFLCGMVLIPVTFGAAMPILAIGCAVWGGVAASNHNSGINRPYGVT